MGFGFDSFSTMGTLQDIHDGFVSGMYGKLVVQQVSHIIVPPESTC